MCSQYMTDSSIVCRETGTLLRKLFDMWFLTVFHLRLCGNICSNLSLFFSFCHSRLVMDVWTWQMKGKRSWIFCCSLCCPLVLSVISHSSFTAQFTDPCANRSSTQWQMYGSLMQHRNTAGLKLKTKKSMNYKKNYICFGFCCIR